MEEKFKTNHYFILSGLAKLGIFIFFRLEIIQFKMESIFEMAILCLSIYPSEPCIFTNCRPTFFKFLILIEDYMRINDTFRFFDCSEIELCMKYPQK
jgi:hypothetical protein